MQKLHAKYKRQGKMLTASCRKRRADLKAKDDAEGEGRREIARDE